MQLSHVHSTQGTGNLRVMSRLLQILHVVCMYVMCCNTIDFANKLYHQFHRVGYINLPCNNMIADMSDMLILHNTDIVKPFEKMSIVPGSSPIQTTNKGEGGQPLSIWFSPIQLPLYLYTHPCSEAIHTLVQSFSNCQFTGTLDNFRP